MMLTIITQLMFAIVYYLYVMLDYKTTHITLVSGFNPQRIVDSKFMTHSRIS